MMARITLRHLRPTLGVLGAVAAFTGCSTEEPSVLGANPGSNLNVGVELSSTSAQPGQEIALAVGAHGLSDLGALQGSLHFDASRLAYVGQATEGASVTIVNSSRADRGQMRLISYNVAGLNGRSGILVFKVKSVDYTRGLGFDLELASDRKGQLELRHALTAPVAELAALAVPVDAKPMSMNDWNLALYPDQVAAEKPMGPRANQPTIPGEHYGNANLSSEASGVCTGGGTAYVNGLDVSYIANLSVGNFDITGSDFPTRDPIIVSNVAPAPTGTQPIIGLNSNGSRTVDGLDVLAVANEVVGSPRAVVCDLVALPATPGATAVVTGTISSNRTFFTDTLYTIDGIVRVNGGATLTIQPGTRIEGKKVSTSGSPSAIYIERDGFIVAIGEPARPIVMTCDAAVKTKGCWGGLVIAGSGNINGGQGTVANTSATSPVIPGRAATGGCLEQDYEGSGPNPVTLLRFGGCNNADSSGVVKFVRFEYGGFVFASNKELNNFTLGGVGSKTIVDFIQVHAGNDDGMEVFGGGLNVRHLLSTGNSDDGFDYSQGWSGNAQFVIVQQDSLDADKGLEIDNAEPPVALTVTPLTTGALYNSTLIGTLFPNSTSGNAGNNVNDAINLRRGAKTPFFNQVIMGFPAVMDLDDDATCGADVTTEVPWQSVLIADNTRIDNTDIETNCPPFAAGTSIEGLYYNFAAFGNQIAAGAGTTVLRDPYNVLAPDFRPVSAAAVFAGASTSPPAGQGLDVSANYRGAVAPTANAIPWYLPWSRPFTNATTP